MWPPDKENMYGESTTKYYNDGFRVKVDTTIPIIRYVNMEYMNPKRVLQYRVGSENMPLMVVGVAFRNSPVPMQCGMSYQLKDVRRK